MDIFSGSKDHTGCANLTRAHHDEHGAPIREDEEEHHDMEALLQEERGRGRGLTRKRSSRGHLTDVEDLNKEQNKSGTVSKWLGKVFEVNRNDTSVDLNATGSKKLVFAGMNQSKKHIPLPTAVTRSGKARAPETEAR
jgi:hypothetical protein